MDLKIEQVTSLMHLRPNGTVFIHSQGLETYMKNRDFPSPFVLDENKGEMLGNP